MTRRQSILLWSILLTPYVLCVIALSTFWYHSFVPFHWFDDTREWAGLDKLGHFLAAYHLGVFIHEVFRSTNSLQPRNLTWICFIGFVLMLPIEILDGFSPNYGASAADLLANLLGSMACWVHSRYSAPTLLTPKLSFHFTSFAAIRPELLGTILPAQVIKDYNGQTYWLSINVSRWRVLKWWPDWMLLSIGYGADGLLGGDDNRWTNSQGKEVDYTHVLRSPRIVISVDLNAELLIRKNRIFFFLFRPFLLIKFPAPAIEFHTARGVIFHPFYF